VIFIEFFPVDDVPGRIDNDPAAAWRYDLSASHLPDHILCVNNLVCFIKHTLEERVCRMRRVADTTFSLN